MAEITLTTGEVVLVDDEDLERVSSIRWCPQRRKKGGRIEYAQGWNGNRSITMHRFILCAKPGETIDHINGNGLDNRRSNLRFVTQQQNSLNRKSVKGTTSKFRGVCRTKGHHFWEATIYLNGERIRLGWFRDETDAAMAYDDMARQLFGEFARLNFPRANEQSAQQA